MPTEMQKAIAEIAKAAKGIERLAKVFETFNENFVKFANDFNDQGVDLDQLSEDVDKLREIKKRTDEVIRRPFDLYDKVRVTYKNTIMHGKIGVVVRTELDGTVEVEFNNGRTGAEYSADQLEKVIDEPSETVSIHQDGKEVLNLFVADEAGRLYPMEWRHNLGINNIRVMKPDTAMAKLSANENRPMTRSQFDLYNKELYATRVIMNEEDAEGIPDERGRLKPREWRGHFGMPKFDPAETGHEFNENRLMTEEDFRIYNTRVFETGVTKTDAQGKKVPADQHGLDKTVQVESADQSWRGDF